MSTIVKFLGRFGNNIFQLSAALKLSNGGEVLVNPGRGTGIDGFVNLKLTYQAQNFPGGYYQHKKWLLPKEEILPYIKKVNTPRYDWTIHIRGTDYKLFPGVLRSREHICYQLCWLNIRPKDIKVITDDIAYATKLVPYDCEIIRSKDFITDWWILRNSYNIITSPGTFSYTAAYLGNHERVIMTRQSLWDVTGIIDNTSITKGIDLKFDTWELEQDYINIENPKTIHELLISNRIQQWKQQKK